MVEAFAAVVSPLVLFLRGYVKGGEGWFSCICKGLSVLVFLL